MAAITVEQALALALAQYHAARFAEAEATCRQILSVEQHHPEAAHLLGVMASRQGRYEEARQLISQAVENAPGEPEYHSNLGTVYQRLGRPEEAAACYRRALQILPTAPEIHYNLGDVLHGLGKLDESIECCRRALELRPDFAEAQLRLSNALADQREWKEAIPAYERALALRPNDPGVLANLGTACLKAGRFDLALECCERALALDPNKAQAHLTRAILRLLHGDYENGWREYEWRSRVPEYSGLGKLSLPVWEATASGCGALLLHSEQGYGDTLQFFRYLPLLAARLGTARLVLECRPELKRLLEQSNPADVEIVSRLSLSTTPLPAFDAYVPLLGLPLRLGCFEPLPMAGPYLLADPNQRQRWRERLDPAATFHVGLAWEGNPDHPDDRFRSLLPESMAPLLRTAGARFYNLQFKPRRDPRPLLDEGLIDFTEEIGDFADTAALVAELDLVISVDSVSAHLAGALGRPVWTLLPHVPDWRWGLRREDTPWYPTMRLFRQSDDGDWGPVIHQVWEALQTVIP